jgi:hypothetical protein
MEARYATETMTTTMIEAGGAVEEEGDGKNKNREIDDSVVLYLGYINIRLF